MGKDKSVFEGFDLFDPSSRIKTPDPDLISKDENTDDSEATPIELDTEVEKTVTPKVVKTDKEKTTKKTEVTAKTKADEEVTDSTETTPTDDITPDEEEQEQPFSFKPIVSYLSEKGIVDLEEGDLDNLSDNEDALEEVVGKTIKTGITKGIEQFKAAYNEEVQEMLKFVELGGEPKDFYDVYYGNTSFETLKADTEDNQKFIIRQGLKLAGFDDADINDELKDYEDLGKLEAKALTHLNKLRVYEKEQKKALVTAQQEIAEAKETEAKKYWNDLKDDLTKKEEIQGFKVTSKIKDQLWDFIANPDKKTGKTKLQEHNEKNKDAQFLYAYLAMNNWDLTKLKSDVTTKVTSDLRKKLGNFTDSRQKIASGRTNREQEDTQEDPFSGFDKIKIK